MYRQQFLFELRSEIYMPARGLSTHMWSWQVIRWDGLYCGVSYYFRAV